MKTTALIPVDYENTFIPENEGGTGELGVLGGGKLAPFIISTIREVKTAGGLIVPTRDMHPYSADPINNPRGHISFVTSFVGKEALPEALGRGEAPSEKNFITYDEVKNWTEENNGLSQAAGFSVLELQAYLKTAGVQAMWPEHGQEGRPSSDYFGGIEKEGFDYEIKKGHEADKECYSGFGGVDINSGVPMAELLKNVGVKTIKVVGLATDYCIKATALDGVKHGFNVELLTKGIASVDPSSEVENLREMREAGVKITD